MSVIKKYDENLESQGLDEASLDITDYVMENEIQYIISYLRNV